MIRQVFISVFPRLCKETKVKAFKDRAHSPISEQARFRLLLRVISFEIYSSQPYVATGGQIKCHTMQKAGNQGTLDLTRYGFHFPNSSLKSLMSAHTI